MLNPTQKTDTAIMNDTDLAGPLMFCLLFGINLLLVRAQETIYRKIHFYCSYYVDREGSLWIHLWGWCAGLFKYVCCLESHEF